MNITINFYSIDLTLSASKNELGNQPDETIITRKDPKTLNKDLLFIFSAKDSSIYNQKISIAQYYFEKRNRHLTKKARPIRFVYIRSTKKPSEPSMKKITLLLSQEYKIQCFQYYCYQNRHNQNYETYLALNFQNQKTGKIFDLKKPQFDKLKELIFISFENSLKNQKQEQEQEQTKEQPPTKTKESITIKKTQTQIYIPTA